MRDEKERTVFDIRLLSEHTKHLVPRDCDFKYLEEISATIRAALEQKLPVSIMVEDVPEKFKKKGELIICVYTVDHKVFRAALNEQYRNCRVSHDDLPIEDFGADNRARKIILETLEAGSPVYLLPNPWFGDGEFYSIIHREYDAL